MKTSLFQSVFLVNRQFHAEASEIAYRQNTFQFKNLKELRKFTDEYRDLPNQWRHAQIDVSWVYYTFDKLYVEAFLDPLCSTTNNTTEVKYWRKFLSAFRRDIRKDLNAMPGLLEYTVYAKTYTCAQLRYFEFSHLSERPPTLDLSPTILNRVVRNILHPKSLTEHG
jgi:hypothetical protein